MPKTPSARGDCPCRVVGTRRAGVQARRWRPPPGYAMAAGVTSRLWEIGDIVDFLEAWESRRGR
jgi:hypothetical protein